jgi:hypothetical protein
LFDACSASLRSALDPLRDACALKAQELRDLTGAQQRRLRVEVDEVSTAAATRASQIEALAQLTKERRAKRTANSAQTAKRVAEAVETARDVLQSSAADLDAKHRSEVAANEAFLAAQRKAWAGMRADLLSKVDEELQVLENSSVEQLELVLRDRHAELGDFFQAARASLLDAAARLAPLEGEAPKTTSEHSEVMGAVCSLERDVVAAVVSYAEKSAAVSGVAEAGARLEEADTELSAMTASVTKWVAEAQDIVAGQVDAIGNDFSRQQEFADTQLSTAETAIRTREARAQGMAKEARDLVAVSFSSRAATDDKFQDAVGSLTALASVLADEAVDVPRTGSTPKPSEPKLRSVRVEVDENTVPNLLRSELPSSTVSSTDSPWCTPRRRDLPGRAFPA